MGNMLSGVNWLLTSSLKPVRLRRFSTSVFEIPCLMSASNHYVLHQRTLSSATVQLTAYVVRNLQRAISSTCGGLGTPCPKLPPRLFGLITTLH